MSRNIFSRIYIRCLSKPVLPSNLETLPSPISIILSYLDQNLILTDEQVTIFHSLFISRESEKNYNYYYHLIYLSYYIQNARKSFIMFRQKLQRYYFSNNMYQNIYFVRPMIQIAVMKYD